MAAPPQVNGKEESPAVDSQGRRTWKVGTLTYTSGGLAALFGWLLWGDFAWMIKERALWPVVPLVLKQFDASAMVIGIFMGTLPAAIGLVLGPIISYRSDRKRSPRGRRIPYILVTTPIGALSLIGCAFSATFGRWLDPLLGDLSPGVNVLSLASFGVFWTIFEFATVTTNAVFYALINDVVPTAILGRFFGLFRAVSLLAGIIFNFFLLGYAEKYYVITFVSIGLLYGIGFMLMCFKVKEGEYPPVEEDPNGPPGFAGATKSYLTQCFTNSYWWWVFFSVAGGVLMFNPVNIFSVLFAKSLGVGMDVYGSYIAMTFVVSLLVAYPLGVLADKFHPLQLGIVTIIMYVALCCWAGFGAVDSRSFAFALIAHGILSGVFFTTTASMTQKLFPRESYAQFSSAAGIVTAIGNMVLSPLVGKILDVTGQNYRNTFFAGALIGGATLVAFILVYRKFLVLREVH